MKRKGTNFERELLDELWNRGFAAIRVAGSGAMSYPSPDIVASNGKKILAFEVKMRRNLPLYLKKDDLEELLVFSKIFGAEAYFAVKIAYKSWRFFRADKLESLKIDDENFEKGLELGEVLGIYEQRRLTDT